MRRALASARRSLAGDLLELTKYRIALSLSLSASAGYLLAGGPPEQLLRVLLPVFLVSLGASAWNQVLEQDIDALLPRTRHRPLPARRMATWQAVLWGALFLLAGLLGCRGPAQGLLAAGALVYVFGYTPLKRRTAWALVLGAAVGALPVLVGATLAERWTLEVGLAFLVLYAWQFPHTYALHAWEARFWRAAGLPTLAAHRWARRVCLLGGSALAAGALCVLLWRLAPATLAVPLAGALLLGPLRAVRSLWRTDTEQEGRKLFRVSLAFLGALLLVLNMLGWWRWNG